jgi:hypothetical protein
MLQLTAAAALRMKRTLQSVCLNTEPFRIENESNVTLQLVCKTAIP